MASKSLYCFIFASILLLLISMVAGTCTCDHDDISQDDYNDALLFKIVALVTILLAGAVGVSIPIIGKNFPPLRPESDLFFLIKTFAAGVILSTGFIHILPDAFESLTSPCLKESPWGKFPFTGLAAMVGSLGTLMFDAFATGYYRKVHSSKQDSIVVDEEKFVESAEHPLLHNHDNHGHVHGHAALAAPEGLSDLDRVKYKVTSQVLELGIVVHSVIIGISLGASQSLETIKPLAAALCFHQFFEGMGLGGCIAQAAFKSTSTLCMAMFFSLTTPVGIAIGIGITNVYDDSSPTALIVQGLLNSIAAGILIYMALVDLLAHDFMNPRMQANTRLFLGANITLLLGAGFMAILAIWA